MISKFIHVKILPAFKWFFPLLILMSMISTINAQDESKIDPYAQHIMDQMGNLLRNATAYGFNSHVAEDNLPPSDGPIIKLHYEVEVALNRPNKLWVDIRDSHSHRTFTYDGKNINLFFTDTHLYSQASAPATIDEMINFLLDKYGYALPLADLMFSNPSGSLLENVQKGIYAGIHVVKGTPCHHLIFEQENINWQIWVEKGKFAVPRLFVITFKNEKNWPQFSAELSDWTITNKFEEVLFIFEPPPGATEIDFLEVTETVSEK